MRGFGPILGILIVLLLLAGIGVGIYLLKNPQIFKSHGQQVDFGSTALEYAVNNFRSQNGVNRSLVSVRNLEVSARNHNVAMETCMRQYQALSSCYGHQAVGEPDIASRIKAVFYNYTNASENVGRQPSSTPDIQYIINGWANEPAHRAGMLDPTISSIGCDSLVGGWGVWWTCDFGAGSATAAPPAPLPAPPPLVPSTTPSLAPSTPPSTAPSTSPPQSTYGSSSMESLINSLRQQSGIGSLNPVKNLEVAARNHNIYLANCIRQFGYATCSVEPIPLHQVTQLGEVPAAARVAATNYVMATNESDAGEVTGIVERTPAPDSSPNTMLNTWIASSTHHAVLLGQQVSDIGCDGLTSGIETLWTCDLAAHSSIGTPPDPIQLPASSSSPTPSSSSQACKITPDSSLKSSCADCLVNTLANLKSDYNYFGLSACSNSAIITNYCSEFNPSQCNNLKTTTCKNSC